ncbi:hypothetical protein [Actinocorallia populi]|uniref:hypothetical protein n=1 Tax=Actinocorallia populi TaxID=2079200 RepID=UPI000D08D650|nr:hypothetical protein [Actinocorallia populi]
MSTRVTLCTIAGVLLLTGCQDDRSASTPPASKAPASASPPAGQPPAQGQVLRSRGLTVTVPAGWSRVDPATDTSELVQVSWGVKDNPFGGLITDLQAELKDKGAVWALDPASATGSFAHHLSAACDSGGLTGSDLESLRKKAQAKEGAQAEDTQVGGRPALRITQTGTRNHDQVAYKSVEVRVPVSADEYCYVSLEGSPQTLTPTVTDPVLASFTLG